MNQAKVGLGLGVRVRVSLSYNLSTVFRDVFVQVQRFDVKSRPFWFLQNIVEWPKKKKQV